jgi:hypothetical protein
VKVTLCLALAALLSASSAAPTVLAESTPVAATPDVVREIQVTVERVRERFTARDTAGVLAYVSEQYRSAGLTKAAVREQLRAIYALYEEVRARVRIDGVEMVEGRAQVFTTGDVSGRLPGLGWVTVLSWQKQPEIARREGKSWRLFGYQD